MGLDITAYAQLTKIPKPEVDADGNSVDEEILHFPWAKDQDENFPGRSQGIDTEAYYIHGESFGFRAGSYSGYNAWRNQLAIFAGYKSDRDCWDNHKEGPFFELIHFSDCEGIIGPVVANKLAIDFVKFREKARVHTISAEWDCHFFRKYEEWEKAFTMAAYNGIVEFH